MNFIQQAYRGKNEWWRYLLVLILVFLGWQLFGIIPLVMIAYNASANLEEFMRGSENAFVDLPIDNNLYLFAMLMMFVIGLAFLLLGVKSVHQRPIKTLITSRKTIDWKRVFFGFSLWFLIALGFVILDFVIYPENYEMNFNAVPFAILLVLSVLLIPLQTSFEEILFRGYFMQGLGIWFRNASVPLIVTSVCFGLLHGFNPEVEKLGRMILLYYIGTGFLFGILTLMDEGMELALGMHAANNMVAALFVTTQWAAFQTDAILKDVSEPDLGMEMFLPVFVVYPLVIYFLSKKYGWTNWKERLFGKISEPLRNDEQRIDA